MVNRKSKEENCKIDPRCPTFNKYLLPKELIREWGENCFLPQKKKIKREIFPRMW